MVHKVPEFMQRFILNLRLIIGIKIVSCAESEYISIRKKKKTREKTSQRNHWTSHSRLKMYALKCKRTNSFCCILFYASSTICCWAFVSFIHWLNFSYLYLCLCTKFVLRMRTSISYVCVSVLGMHVLVLASVSYRENRVCEKERETTMVSIEC